jgi:hypothetical protein
MRPYPSLTAAAAVFVAAGVTIAACGARSGLPEPPVEPTRSSAFCARATYDGGASQLEIFLLLDRSDSMKDDAKWDQVTAAIGAFVDDPQTGGLGLGLQFFPLGSACADDKYLNPAVGLAPLPMIGPKIKSVLSATAPAGDTPTLPALRGAIEYARAARLADPKSRVFVALATDGAPNTCSSSTSAVVEAAKSGAQNDPQVLTFVISIETGYLADLGQIAQAGGTGAPIVITADASSAQQFVNALKRIRDADQSCRFAVPATPGSVPASTDLGVSLASKQGSSRVAHLVASLAACPSQGDAFYVESAEKQGDPGVVVLCPATCATTHAVGDERVTVTAGCGDGSNPTPPQRDAGVCGGSVDFSCVTVCGSPDSIAPICVDDLWVCPPGTVTTTSCASCPPIPHGCCKPDGSLAVASCVNGAWTCPPGGTIFGEGNCKPPTVCAPSLPCALGERCVDPSSSCGQSSVAGACAPIPSSCNDPPQPVCGCDGGVYASACAAALAGVDIGVERCKPPPGQFACGPLLCKNAGQICRKTLVNGGPATYACVPTPPNCPEGCGCKLCACACSEQCTSGNGGPQVTCLPL